MGSLSARCVLRISHCFPHHPARNAKNGRRKGMRARALAAASYPALARRSFRVIVVGQTVQHPGGVRLCITRYAVPCQSNRPLPCTPQGCDRAVWDSDRQQVPYDRRIVASLSGRRGSGGRRVHRTAAPPCTVLCKVSSFLDDCCGTWQLARGTRATRED